MWCIEASGEEHSAADGMAAGPSTEDVPPALSWMDDVVTIEVPED